MLLRTVTISGFRSVARTIEIHVRERLTCLIGANEHGKTNLLEAVSRLTTRQIGADDLNSTAREGDLPRIAFRLELLGNECNILVAKLKERLAAAETGLKEAAASQQPAEKQSKYREAISFYGRAVESYRSASSALLNATLHRDNRLTLHLTSFTLTLEAGKKVEEAIGLKLPEVRLFSPSEELADTITLAELEAKKNLPFEGLLRLAGVWEKRQAMFSGDLNAHRLHVRAGKTITRKLRAIWTQGEAHTFRLSESGGRLRISIEDPTTLDSPSRRSLGFRSFLSFALTLYAETDTFTPHGYILLFDEPGLHLHPQGQKDLLRELRRLAKKNQILYTTHSPFLIDRNDPTAALLVRKELRGKQRGTSIVQKPYGANWISVSNALGITPADAFFAPDKALIVEGTSDRLYLTRYMALCSSISHADLNYLHIVDADRRDEIPGTARLYLAAGSSLVVLVDADKGGDDFTKFFKRLFSKEKGRLSVLNLRGFANANLPLSIEDLLPLDLWFAALTRYAREILGYKEDLFSQSDLLAHKSGVTLGVASGEYLKQLGLLKSSRQFSKTTVADLYCQQELPVPQPDSALARLCVELTRLLNLAI